MIAMGNDIAWNSLIKRGAFKMQDRGYVEAALKIQLHAARYLKNLSRYNINFELWQQNIQNLLISLYGPSAPEVVKYQNIRFEPGKNRIYDIPQYHQSYLEGLNASIALIDAMIKGSKPCSEMDLLADVKAFLSFRALSEDEKKKVLTELAALLDSLEAIDPSQKPWDWEIQQNKIVRLLNDVCLNKKPVIQ